MSELFSECWLFLGSKNRTGYGRLGGTLAHRLSWQAHRGPIPNSLWVLHHCDLPHCINPDHLYVGTPHDNNMDVYRRNRRKVARGLAKINATQAKAIRESEEPTKSLAEEYKLDISTIQRIRRGVLWNPSKI